MKTHAAAQTTMIVTFAGMYCGADLEVKVKGPMILATQKDMSSNAFIVTWRYKSAIVRVTPSRKSFAHLLGVSGVVGGNP